MLRRRLHRSTLLASVSAALAACGGGGADEGGGPDPATVMPPSAPVYIEVAVKPEGQRREDALAAARKVMRTDDPESKLLDLFRDSVKHEDLNLDYNRDIEPWLGERAGMVLRDPEADEPPTMIALAATDTAKARSTVSALRRDAGQKLRTASYEGVEYDVDREGTASGVVDDFLVFADEPLFKQGVDASTGESLAESGGYQDAIAGLDDDRVATVYFTAETTFGLSGEGSAENRQLNDQVQRAFGLDKVPPMAMGVVADGERIALQSDYSVAGGSEAYRRFADLGGSAAAPLVADAPADAWAAYGVPDLGGMTRTLLTTFAGAAGTSAVTNSIRDMTGLDLEQDLLAWMGNAAVFVRGHDEATLDGALVVEAKEAGAAERALPKIAEALAARAPGGDVESATVEGADLAYQLELPSAAKPIILAVGKGRMVAAFGEGAARAALVPAERLGDTAEYEAVTESLDDDLEPVIYLSMPGVLKAFDGFADGSDPTYVKVRRYLEAFGAIASGGRREGDQVEWAAAARLK